MTQRSRLMEHDRCMRCDEIRCINFYRWTKSKPAGEITTYKRMIKKRSHRPCEAGFLIYSFCQIFQPFSHDFLSSSLVYQCICDLKASVFLLWFGHYRSSIQILRPIVENLLTALFFDTKFNQAQDEAEKEEIRKDYTRFCKNEYEVPESEWLGIFPALERRRYLDQNFLLEWLFKRGRITGRDKNRMQKLIGRLNRYLHPHIEYIEISKSHSPNCPALVAWDDDKYKRCIKLLQDVIAELLWLFRHHIKKFYPRRWGYKRTQSTLEELKILEAWEAELSRKLIFSGCLRDFIHELP